MMLHMRPLQDSGGLLQLPYSCITKFQKKKITLEYDTSRSAIGPILM